MDAVRDIFTSFVCLMMIISTIVKVTALECYTCPLVEDNDNCSKPENVATCRVGDDMCFTEIQFEGGSRYKVKKLTKSCVMSTFCKEEKSLYNPGKCIRKDEDYICVNCCRENRCNASAGVAMARDFQRHYLFIEKKIITAVAMMAAE
ncbi:ly6/PLAUR domain-containing protein 1-like [Glandiceps talaboti]